MTNLDKVLKQAHEKTGLTGKDLQKFVCLFLADQCLSKGKFETAKKVLDKA